MMEKSDEEGVECLQGYFDRQREREREREGERERERERAREREGMVVEKRLSSKKE